VDGRLAGINCPVVCPVAFLVRPKAVAVSRCGKEHLHKMPYILWLLQWRPLMSDNIFYVNGHLSVLRKVKTLILDPHPDHDQHQNFITSTGSAFTHACHVWSVDVRVRELSCSHAEWLTARSITLLRQPIAYWWSNHLRCKDNESTTSWQRSGRHLDQNQN